MIQVGIDGGSRTIKVALWEPGRGVLGTGMTDQGIDQERLARQLLERTLATHGRSADDVAGIVATGYARRLIRDARHVTEISCHARGVRELCPDARTVIDIGGQDAKVIRVDDDGRVADFAMNDRCAAGTGRFLEMLAIRLEIPLTRLGELLADGVDCAAISSMCVVFAESEIVGLLAGGCRPGAIARGVETAIAQRVAALAGAGWREPVVMTGGVALVAGMSSALATALGRPVHVCPHAVFAGAIGAALLAQTQSP